MLHVHNFQFGLLTPAPAYLISALGAFLGLRCATRARAYRGRARARWLLLSAVSIGTTGIWAMHFIAMAGVTVSGKIVRYNALVIVLSLLIAVIAVGGGLLIVGFGQQSGRNLLLAGLVTGIGAAGVFYTGMAAMRMPARMTYSPALFALSVIIAIVASTGLFWAAFRLHGALSTLGAALIIGIAVTGMHYTGMAAMHLFSVPRTAGMIVTGVTPTGSLLTLVIGITTVVTFALIATIAMSPTEEEIHAEAALLERSRARGLQV